MCQTKCLGFKVRVPVEYCEQKPYLHHNHMKDRVSAGQWTTSEVNFKGCYWIPTRIILVHSSPVIPFSKITYPLISEL